MNNGALAVRRARPAAELNPAYYTRSGWRRPAKQPLETDPSGGQAGQPPRQAAPAIVHLNTASQAELETLPGIGPVTARKIIRFREQNPFTRIEDLELVPGIGPKTMEAVGALVTTD